MTSWMNERTELKRRRKSIAFQRNEEDAKSKYEQELKKKTWIKAFFSFTVIVGQPAFHESEVLLQKEGILGLAITLTK